MRAAAALYRGNKIQREKPPPAVAREKFMAFRLGARDSLTCHSAAPRAKDISVVLYVHGKTVGSRFLYSRRAWEIYDYLIYTRG